MKFNISRKTVIISLSVVFIPLVLAFVYLAYLNSYYYLGQYLYNNKSLPSFYNPVKAAELFAKSSEVMPDIFYISEVAQSGGYQLAAITLLDSYSEDGYSQEVREKIYYYLNEAAKRNNPHAPLFLLFAYMFDGRMDVMDSQFGFKTEFDCEKAKQAYSYWIGSKKWYDKWQEIPDMEPDIKEISLKCAIDKLCLNPDAIGADMWQDCIDEQLKDK